MEINNVYSIYFSPSGTTKKIVKRISSFFRKEKVSYHSLLSQRKVNQTLSPKELLIIGLPVFSGRIPSLCKELLKELHGMNTPAIVIVSYGNRDYEDALIELKNTLETQGFNIIGAAAFIAQHSIFTDVAKSRPDKKDIEIIDSFSKKCFKYLDFYPNNYKTLDIKGNIPYRKISKMPITPSTNKNCNYCGICSEMCPVHAIDMNNPKNTNKQLCISCTACISVCPQHARKFSGLLYHFAAKKFSKKYKQRKEPEVFIQDK